MLPAIQLSDVTFRFRKDGRRNILDHADLSLGGKGITVVMGASGCGKSTLAAVAAGLYPENGGYLEGGSIRLYGDSLAGMDPARRARYLTVMFQNPDLQFCMDTLRREMIFCLENIGCPADQIDGRIAEAAGLLHMTDCLDRPLCVLSGGEKQKATLCCLLAMDSRCILLDEPFANIDPEAADEIVGLLRALCAEGRSILAIDHRLDHWLDAADEIVLLGEGGHMLARGITKENLSEYRALFAEEGISFPEEAVRRKRTPSDAPAAIRFEGVSVAVPQEKRLFRKQEAPVLLLKDAEAAFPAGKMTAVLGPSGCGKTTTFLAVMKQRPYTGTILLNGRDLRNIKPAALYQTIGIVFQNPANQFITQNVLDEVKAGIRAWERRIGDVECTQRAEDMLAQYGLLRFRRYSPYMLSQGQQRRLAVLSVLAGHQQILFLDEPTYGQDQRSTDAIMHQLQEKTEREGLTVVFITHDRPLAQRWADRIYRMADNTLKEELP